MKALVAAGVGARTGHVWLWASVRACCGGADLAFGACVAPADCQIAAIARSHGMAVATRNTRGFIDMELDLIDPWAEA